MSGIQEILCVLSLVFFVMLVLKSTHVVWYLCVDDPVRSKIKSTADSTETPNNRKASNFKGCNFKKTRWMKSVMERIPTEATVMR